MQPHTWPLLIRAVFIVLVIAVQLCQTGQGLKTTPQKSLGGRQRSGGGSKQPWIEQISREPRAFIYHNLLTDEEADHIVNLAKPFMKRSTVVGQKGGSVLDDIRTSYGTFIKRLQDPVITAVEERVATWTHLNISHQEDLQILRYGLGQKYGAHYDSLMNDSPRVATVLLYLSDVEAGGETAFPQGSKWLDPSLPERLGPFGPCAEGHVAAKPRKGSALLFFSLHPDGRQDYHSMHTGCPVIEGVKWTGTIWIHTTPFRPYTLGNTQPEKMVFPEDCTNNNELCDTWAESGECEGNAPYMRGDATTLGECRRACGDCEVCRPDDTACKSRNRVRTGYLPLEDL